MLYKIDSRGYIINEASKRKIAPYYKKIVDDIVGYYKQYLKNDIFGIYIRGSVPLGRAKKIIKTQLP